MVPFSFKPFSIALAKYAPKKMKPENKTAGEGGMEIVGIPWNPVMPIVNVRICVVPEPVHKLYTNNIIGYINQDNC